MKSDQFRVSKHKMENGEQEMQACFSKLKELVPSVPQDKKLSKVQLLQHVIDYILDLELTLDSHPSIRTSPSIIKALSETRKPLAESLHLNTLQPTQMDVEDSSTLCTTPVSS